MKLSEAIRLGAMLKPQCFGRYFYRDGSCALGAAADALGVQVDQLCVGNGTIVPQIYASNWPRSSVTFMFMTVPPLCPACGQQRAAVDCLIRHLNDEHRWTREQIADVVARIEAQQELQAPVEAPREPVAVAQTA